MTNDLHPQAPEFAGTLTCYSVKKTVTGDRRLGWNAGGSLHTQDGQRRFLNHAERQRALLAADGLSDERSLFIQMLAWTGARLSEVLALSPRSFQIESGVVTIVTLKRRKHCIREVPIPDELMAALDRVFNLQRAQREESAGTTRIWDFCRMTAWRIVKALMRAAGIVGPQACPKGFRHGFGHIAVRNGTPLHLIQRWMGHARLSTTTIYMGLSGPDERQFAERLWRDTLTPARRDTPSLSLPRAA